MSYEKISVQTGPNMGIILYGCKDCGAVCFDTQVHTDFHTRQGKVSADASYAAGMMRPLGGI